MKFFKRDKVALTTRPKPDFIGYLESFSGGWIVGWVADKNNLAESLKVRLYIGDQMLKESIADIYRADVAESGYSGSHGFEFGLDPLGFINNDDSTISLLCISADFTCSIAISEPIRQSIATFVLSSEQADASRKMYIRESLAVWGKNEDYIKPLVSNIYYDAVYLPFKPHTHLDHNKEWGVYDSTGRLIPEAAYRRGEGLTLVGQSERIDLRKFLIEDAPQETMIYAGPILTHYGHFLLTSLSRLWAVKPTEDFMLFHSDPSMFEHRTTYVLDLLARAGINKSNACSFSLPTRIKRLIVPEPALVEQHGVSAKYQETLKGVGDSYPSLGITEDCKYYLSKSKLSSGVSRLNSERVIEDVFRQIGFEVIYPETMLLEEQIEVFRNASFIAGTSGSGFHTQALAPNAKCLKIIISYSDFINSNFLLVDRNTQGKSCFISISDFVFESRNPGGFNLPWDMHSPGRLSARLKECVLEKMCQSA